MMRASRVQPDQRATGDRGQASVLMRASRVKPDRRATGDRGQAAVLLLALALTLAVVLGAAVAEFGGHAVDRVRAQSAADAAALASIDGGRQAAEDLAMRNGAVVVSWRRGPGPGEVTVTVRVGDSTATARASVAP